MSSKIQTNYSRKYLNKYKKEFTLANDGNLFCNLCMVNINPSRKSVVDNHRNSQKHVKNLKALDNQTLHQSFLTPTRTEFIKLLTSAFVSADIPLHKLRNRKLVALFDFMTFKLPSESMVRNYLCSEFYLQVKKEIVDYFRGQKIFLLIDESEIHGKKYFVVLGGRIDLNQHIKAIECISLNAAMNSTNLVSIIIRILEDISVSKKDLMLLIGDSARYNIKAANDLKLVCSNMFYINCLAHLVHNCALKVKSYYANVDNLISSMKALTIKNKTNKEIFNEIGGIPIPIVTRWSSWLRAADYYCTNLNKVRILFQGIKRDGIIYEKAKIACFHESLYAELIDIKDSYKVLIEFIDSLEECDKGIQFNWNRIKEIDFGNDPIDLKKYLKSRLEQFDVQKIMSYENQDISPCDYSDIMKCPSTSIVIERSFSMLKAILRFNRHFLPENLGNYFISYYNGLDHGDVDNVDDEKNI